MTELSWIPPAVYVATSYPCVYAVYRVKARYGDVHPVEAMLLTLVAPLTIAWQCMCGAVWLACLLVDAACHLAFPPAKS